MVNSAERTGYPTQKPLALYERIIQASSNEGDLVLDPFAGCATTPIAAERLGRQWVGYPIDLWDGSLGIVRRRLQDNRQLLTDIPTIHYETDPPVRTDGSEEAAPFIQVTGRYAEPEGPRMSRAAMYDHLLADRSTDGAARAATAPSTIPATWSWTTTPRAAMAAGTTSRTACCSADPATGPRATPTPCPACGG